MTDLLNSMAGLTPGLEDKSLAAGMTSGAQRKATIQADLAAAPEVADAAANQAGQVATATGQAGVDVETANREQIAANAAETAKAEAAAREGAQTTEIMKLQRDRQAAADRGDTRAVAEIDAVIQAKAASQTYDPRSASQLSKTEIRDAAKAVVQTIQSMGEIVKMQQMFADTPQAAGAIGSAFETISGVIGSLGSLVGADISLPGDKDVTAARTQARLVVRSIAQGLEKSDRISNQDRHNASEIARALDGDSSAQQVYAAAQSTIGLMEREMTTAADQLLAQIDVLSDEGVDKAAKTLGANGVPKSQFERIILAVRARRR